MKNQKETSENLVKVNTSENTNDVDIAAKYGGLNNEELMLIYYKLKSQTDKLEKNLNAKRIAKPIDTPYGEGMAFIEVPQKHVDMFRNTEYYKLLHSVLKKLEPIVQLLEECDGSLKNLAHELR